jgi:hypothetical protein
VHTGGGDMIKPDLPQRLGIHMWYLWVEKSVPTLHAGRCFISQEADRVRTLVCAQEAGYSSGLKVGV